MICKASITSALDVTCTLMSLKESLPVAVFMGRSVGIMQAGMQAITTTKGRWRIAMHVCICL